LFGKAKPTKDPGGDGTDARLEIYMGMGSFGKDLGVHS